MSSRLPGEESGRGPRPRYPLGRLLLVVVVAFIASSVLQLAFPGMGTPVRLSILVILAALIPLLVTWRRHKRPPD